MMSSLHLVDIVTYEPLILQPPKAILRDAIQSAMPYIINAIAVAMVSVHFTDQWQIVGPDDAGKAVSIFPPPGMYLPSIAIY